MATRTTDPQERVRLWNDLIRELGRLLAADRRLDRRVPPYSEAEQLEMLIHAVRQLATKKEAQR